MSQNESKPQQTVNSLFIAPGDYFRELVREGLSQRKIETFPHVESYLVYLLEHHLDARNLFDPEYDESGRKIPNTLAEMYLHANNSSDQVVRVELLKKLGDRSLYVSGFFADSLQRKLVDVDYYVNMGGVAYAALASCVREDASARVYSTISQRFVEFMDVLTYISHSSLIQTNESVLRLYDRYMATGSEMAREKLTEMGVLPIGQDQAKRGRQY